MSSEMWKLTQKEIDSIEWSYDIRIRPPEYISVKIKIFAQPHQNLLIAAFSAMLNGKALLITVGSNPVKIHHVAVEQGFLPSIVKYAWLEGYAYRDQQPPGSSYPDMKFTEEA